MSAGLSVAVVSFNTRELTLRCLSATERAAPEGEAALTLVDNGSRDGTVEAVRARHPRWALLVLADNPGYGTALNRAFGQRPAPFLLALNADVTLDPPALRRLRTFLEGAPRCALAGPALVYPDGRPQPSAKRFPTPGFALAEVLGLHALRPGSRAVRRFYYADRALSGPSVVDAVSGAVMLIRGEAYRRLGGFDEGFRMYFEETDLCRRLRAAGLEVAFVPGARAVHWHGASSVQTSVRRVDYYLSYVRYVRKHHGPGAARLLAAAVALGTAVRMLALVVRYPPLGARRAARLGAKLAACERLLARLAGRPGRACP